MDTLSISRGQQVMLGKPAKPLPQNYVDQLRSLVGSTPGIMEAHLPQCFIPGTMELPAQVLFIVIAPGVAAPTVAERLGQGISEILPGGQHLDVIPLAQDSSLLASVRDTGCFVGKSSAGPQERPWWKFW